MNILFWTEFFAPYIGGIEIRVGQLASELARRGHHCGVVTDAFAPSLPDREIRDGIIIHRLPIRTTLASRDLGQLRRVVSDISSLRREFRADIDAAFVAGPSIAVLQLSNAAARGPTVATMQLDLEEQLRAGSGLRRFLGDCAGIVTVSEFVRRYLSSCAPELVGKMELVPNALPRPALMPSPLPLNPPTILCLGRLIPEKGFDVALRAFARLDDSFNRARMIVAGDGPDRRNLETLCRDLRLDARVDFLGWVNPDDVPALINRATIMVTPSRWKEAFGLVSLQAAQMKRPVVATRVGGIPEVVVDGQTGLLVENEDPDAMAKALGRLLGDPGLLQAMGEAGYQRAHERFYFPHYVDTYEALLMKFAKASR